MKNMRRWHIIESTFRANAPTHLLPPTAPTQQANTYSQNALRGTPKSRRSPYEHDGRVPATLRPMRVQLLVMLWQGRTFALRLLRRFLAHKGTHPYLQKDRGTEGVPITAPLCHRGAATGSPPTLTPKQLAKALHFLRREHRLPS